VDNLSAITAITTSPYLGQNQSQLRSFSLMPCVSPKLVKTVLETLSENDCELNVD